MKAAPSVRAAIPAVAAQAITPDRARPQQRTSTTPTATRERLFERAAELGLLLAGFFAIVIVVAGGAAVALLAWPSHSGTTFSWDLGPAPAAALIGGLYAASVVVFADALRRSRSDTWPTRIGIFGLALPTLAFTAVQHDVFDWSRPQALGWVFLFACAPVSILADLRRPTRPSSSPKASGRIRILLGVVSAAAAAFAIVLWVASTRTWLGERSPIPLAGLTSNYLGAWCTFIALASATACVRGRSSDARSTGVLLGSVSAGAALAAARTATDLEANATTYLAVLAGLAVIASALIVTSISNTNQRK